MLGSLRVRLPLVFLAGIVLAGLITTLIAVRLFQDFAHDQALTSLNREAHGIAGLYSDAINASYGNPSDRAAPAFAARNLERATGAKIYFLGPKRPFPGQRTGLERLTLTTIDWTSGKSLTFEFTPPGAHKTYLAVANPIFLDKQPVGAIVVATKKTDVSHRVAQLVGRLAIAGVLGLLVAALLAGYLSRRIVRPVLQLSDAADEVAAGNYAVAVPQNAPGELGHLSARFGEMAGRLAEAELMERNFLMSVSHELRTPLTAIRGQIEVLARARHASADEIGATAEVVAREVGRMGRLVDDMLLLARTDEGTAPATKPLEVGTFLPGTLAGLFRGVDRKLDLAEVPSGTLIADSDGITQVIRNLVRNAIEHTSEGGSILITATGTDRWLRLSVEDDGPGIPPEQRERIFARFYRADSSRNPRTGGSGLGLAIAKAIVEAHGGRIWVDDAAGGGARVSFELPGFQATP